MRAAHRAPSRSLSRVFLGLGLAFGLGLGLSGCGHPCEQLRTFVCDGGDEAYCQQVDGFLKEMQVDAEGNPLDDAAAEESCRYIMGNVEVQNAYRFKAKERFLGEPYFQVLKNMKPAERAAWRAKHGIPEPEPVVADDAAAKPEAAEPEAAAKTPAK